MGDNVTSDGRVLVVDGDRYFRETIREALSADALACELAGSGAEAQKAIEDPRVACVVLDVRVEPPHALDLLDALLAGRPALRVIALAGHADQELVLEALRRGACDYLAKPVHDEELCLAVRRALDGHDALSRWQATRERVARLADLADEIGAAARAGAGRETLAARATTALVDVLGAARADAERVVKEAGRPVDAVEGVVRDEDLGLLRLFAGLVGRWLEAPAAAAEAPRAAEPAAGAESEARLELLREMAEALTREVEPERVLGAALRPVARITSARAAAIFLIDNRTGRLVREAGVEGADVERRDLPRDRGLTGGCLQSGALVATDRPERDPRFDPAVDTPEGGEPGPLLVVPLRMRDRVLGVARVFPAPEVGASARLAELLTAPLSAATRNVLLYRSLLESVEDVARARREAETGRRS